MYRVLCVLALVICCACGETATSETYGMTVEKPILNPNRNSLRGAGGLPNIFPGHYPNWGADGAMTDVEKQTKILYDSFSKISIACSRAAQALEEAEKRAGNARMMARAVKVYGSGTNSTVVGNAVRKAEEAAQRAEYAVSDAVLAVSDVYLASEMYEERAKKILTLIYSDAPNVETIKKAVADAQMFEIKAEEAAAKAEKAALDTFKAEAEVAQVAEARGAAAESNGSHTVATETAPGVKRAEKKPTGEGNSLDGAGDSLARAEETVEMANKLVAEATAALNEFVPGENAETSRKMEEIRATEEKSRKLLEMANAGLTRATTAPTGTAWIEEAARKIENDAKKAIEAAVQVKTDIAAMKKKLPQTNETIRVNTDGNNNGTKNISSTVEKGVNKDQEGQQVSKQHNDGTSSNRDIMSQSVFIVLLTLVATCIL